MVFGISCRNYWVNPINEANLLENIFLLETSGQKKFCLFCGRKDATVVRHAHKIYASCRKCQKFTQKIISKVDETGRIPEIKNFFCNDKSILEEQSKIRTFPKNKLLNFFIVSSEMPKNSYKVNEQFSNCVAKTVNFCSVEEIPLEDLANYDVGIFKSCIRCHEFKTLLDNEGLEKKLVKYFMDLYVSFFSTENSLLWIIEMPAVINYKFRNLISRFLKTNPVVIQVSPNNLLTYKLIWSNINLSENHLDEITDLITS